MADLGDISELMKEGSGAGPNNLDWLDVDEKAYRELDTLPKQNLDSVPDLEAAWSHEDNSPAAYFVPNRDMAGYPVDPRVPTAPNTMGDMSQVHGPLRLEEEPVVRTARLALMQHNDLNRWREAIFSRFAKQTLGQHKTALAGVLKERGLLGRFYIDASDFPNCATAKSAAEFVRRHANDAKFVKAKEACGNCTRKVTMGNAQHCGVFHKQIVQDLPFTPEMASKVEVEQEARGMTARAPEGSDPATRIKTAYLNAPVRPMVQGYSGQSNAGAVIPAERLFQKSANVQAQQASLDEQKARPIVAMLRRELLKGRTATEIAKGLQLAFDPRDLKATQQYWAPLFKEAGLYGTIYSTQDSFDDCRIGADFLSKHGSKVKAIVAGEKCSSCIFAKVGRCMMYGRKLVAQAEDLFTDATVSEVLNEHKMAGHISPVLVNQTWGENPREALKNIHKAASHVDPTAQDYTRLSMQQAFHGTSMAHRTSELTRREILKSASKFLNEGLYGSDLEMALRSKFDPRDLTAAADGLKTVVAEQGLQGIYFIDPTVYDDYGRGCKEAQRLHRSRQAVEYAKVGDKCSSCVHQTRLGYCSVLNKKLAVEVPYTDKVAQQQAVLASGRSTEIDYGSLVNNGLTMMQDFELQGSQVQVDVNPVDSVEASIQFGSNDVDISKL